MLRFAARRLVISVPVLVLVSLMSFAVIYLVPGDAASMFLDPGATPEQLANVRRKTGITNDVLRFTKYEGERTYAKAA